MTAASSADVREEDPPGEPWDELRDAGGHARPAAHELLAAVERIGVEELRARQAAAAADILTMGITFTVYSEGSNIDRAWPFDVIPRVIEATEWRRIERGLVQRLKALNCFIDDLYNERRIIDDGVFPGDLLADSANYREECRGVHPKFGVWAHISGSDLVRDGDGTMYVLEDNLRVPSGVSYVLENRAVAKRAFPEIFARQSIAPVDAYTDELNKLLSSLAPDEHPAAVDRRAHARASSTRPTSSTRSSPSGWAPRSSRAATSSSPRATGCSCGRSTGSSRSTSSTAASTTCSSTPRCSTPSRCSACRG